jgi:hypothetical protein
LKEKENEEEISKTPKKRKKVDKSKKEDNQEKRTVREKTRQLTIERGMEREFFEQEKVRRKVTSSKT